MLIVADAGPVHYLVLIGGIELLPQLFGTVLVPEIVCREISHARTPPVVRGWIAQPPAWLRIAPTPSAETLPFPKLDVGERAALALAMERGADLLLMDDRRAVATAQAHGLETIGTLGVIDRAASRGLIDFVEAADRLTETNFRYPPNLLDALRAQHGRRGGKA